MAKRAKFALIGVCGLACRLCPMHNSSGKSPCPGCKTDYRMGYWCPHLSCAWKKKGLEFCWECDEMKSCDRWAQRIRFSRSHDTMITYRDLEDNVTLMRKKGAKALDDELRRRERLLIRMLKGFNEGRSKSFYCVAARLLPIKDLEDALNDAGKASKGNDLKAKAAALRDALEKRAARRKLSLRLRK